MATPAAGAKECEARSRKAGVGLGSLGLPRQALFAREFLEAEQHQGVLGGILGRRKAGTKHSMASAAAGAKEGGAGGGGGGAGKGSKVAGAGGQALETSLKRKRGLFSKDFRFMMYGFGDDPDPLPEPVLLVEDILLDYIMDMIHKAQEVASRRGKLMTEDIMFLVRKDSRKFAHVKELLAMNEELKRARKAFEVDEEKFSLDE